MSPVLAAAKLHIVAAVLERQASAIHDLAANLKASDLLDRDGLALLASAQKEASAAAWFVKRTAQRLDT